MARILIVDDALFIRHGMKTTLSAVGHEVVAEAENGLDGLRKVARFDPELVILDINMPEMDGVRMLEVLRRNHPMTRVLACSSLVSGPQTQQLAELGIQGALRKPYLPEDLIAAVMMALVSPMEQPAIAQQTA
ncbi:MAG: response regulator [Candidatus Sericytochromatia bacterium]|nr:response regulator [Candidatus Sericytochromatia bacterium]